MGLNRYLAWALKNEKWEIAASSSAKGHFPKGGYGCLFSLTLEY